VGLADGPRRLVGDAGGGGVNPLVAELAYLRTRPALTNALGGWGVE
jgi:hypothetical protein